MTYMALAFSLCLGAVFFSQWSIDPLPVEALPAILVLILVFSAPISSWLRGRRDVFDPVVVLSLFGLHFFVFGPIYQYTSRYFPYLRWNPSYDDWVVPWFYLQATFICIAFGSFRLFALEKKQVRERPELPKGVREILFRAMLVTCAIKVTTLALFGGFGGVAAAYNQRLAVGVLEYNPFAGMGVLVLVGDMFPLALGLYLIVRFRSSKFFLSSAGLVSFGGLIAVVSLLFVGLQGSRSSVIFAIVLVMLSYHFLAKPLGKRHLLAGVVAVTVFMQAYLAYKFGGLDAVFDADARELAYSQRAFTDEGSFVLIRDFTRMDTQVITLQAVFESGFPLAWGRSIVSGVTSILPSALVPWRGTTFILEKSQILVPGRSFTQAEATTLVFGMFGELVVNFGIGAMLFAPVYGWLLRQAKKINNAASWSAASAFIAPAFVLLPIAVLVYDSNSLMFFLVQSCALSGVMFFLVRRMERRQRERANAVASQDRLASASRSS